MPKTACHILSYTGYAAMLKVTYVSNAFDIPCKGRAMPLAPWAHVLGSVHISSTYVHLHQIVVLFIATHDIVCTFTWLWPWSQKVAHIGAPMWSIL